MIPFAICGALLQMQNSAPLEIRILELSDKTFTFRLDKEMCLPESVVMEMFFYRWDEGSYRTILLPKVSVKLLSKNRFWNMYEGSTTEEAFIQESRHLTREYLQYIHLKTEQDANTLSKVLVGYPSHLDASKASSFQEMEEKWFGEASVVTDWRENFCESLQKEFALCIDNGVLYEKYLDLPFDKFMDHYWESHRLNKHPIAKCKPGRLYVGNQFCHLLFPKEEQLFAILDKAQKENLKITLVFTHLRESLAEETMALLEKVYKYCLEKDIILELVINDLGMLKGLQQYRLLFTFSLGVLLNKHRKDPRLKYLKEYRENPKLFADNALQSEEYLQYLKEQGITGAEWESSGKPLHFARLHNHLHFPYYQTNTSQYCPLYSLCKEGDRGIQYFQRECPHYCEKAYLSYPEHLHMVGVYNSLFGYDESLLKSEDKCLEYKEAGVDRFVIHFL